jgi:hypothetical protein
MTKRLAAAVLCTIVNLLGLPDVSAGGGSVDGDDGSGIAYVELRREWQVPGVSDPAASSDPLTTASDVCGDEIEHAWILRHHSGPSAAVTVRRDASHDHTAVVSLSADLRLLPWEQLLSRSLAFCRDHDVLKVTLEAEGVSSETVRAVAHASGFSFSRLRHADGVDVAEFYTDLYHPDRRDQRPAHLDA